MGKPVAFEGLEERQLLATFTVTSSGDVPILMGTTLREAILMANTTPGPDVIRFNIPGTPTIRPLTALPAVTGETAIDGTTQPGYAPGRPVEFIDGTATLPDVLTGNTDGLRFTGGNSTLRGVIVGGFGGGRACGCRVRAGTCWRGIGSGRTRPAPPITGISRGSWSRGRRTPGSAGRRRPTAT